MTWTDAIRLRWFEEYPPPTTSSLWVLDSEDQAAVLFTLVDRLTALLTRRVELALLEAEAWEAMLREKECAWVENSDGGWETLCGGQFELTSGTPQSNGMAYCCYCGGSLEQIEYTDEAERAAIAATPTEEA